MAIKLVIQPNFDTGIFQCLLLEDVDASKTNTPVKVHPLSQPFQTVGEAVAFIKGYRSASRHQEKENGDV